MITKERGRGRPALNKAPKAEGEDPILKKAQATPIVPRPKQAQRGHSYVLGENGVYERIIRKRKRKSSDQLKTLMREFDRNPNWSKETLLEVSRKTGLSEA